MVRAMGRDCTGCSVARIVLFLRAHSAVRDRHYRLRTIRAPNRFDRTAFHRFFAESFFLWRLRLFIDIGMAAVIVPFEICGRGFAAQIAVDALIIDVEVTGKFSAYLFAASAMLSLKMKWNVRKKPSYRNQCGR